MWHSCLNARPLRPDMYVCIAIMGRADAMRTTPAHIANPGPPIAPWWFSHLCGYQQGRPQHGIARPELLCPTIWGAYLLECLWTSKSPRLIQIYAGCASLAGRLSVSKIVPKHIERHVTVLFGISAQYRVSSARKQVGLS